MHQHNDPAILALRALCGSCARCQSELDQLRAVVASVRRIGPAHYPSAPSPAVWDAIVAELGLSP